MPNKNDSFIKKAAKFCQRHVIVLNKGFNQSRKKLIESLSKINWRQTDTLPPALDERSISKLMIKISLAEQFIDPMVKTLEIKGDNKTEDNTAITSNPGAVSTNSGNTLKTQKRSDPERSDASSAPWEMVKWSHPLLTKTAPVIHM